MDRGIRLSLSVFKKLYPGLSEEEYRVMDYFLTNLSVGEILAVRELERVYGIKNPESVIEILISKGLLERGTGCYNLSKTVREKLRSYKKQLI
ncbi:MULTISPECIES: PolB1-binding protein PBP2 family protein [Fervidicoccus]|uniref:MarR family transcriptional regulator n=2 Tax=Fervidicoccus fontis TaxID=683846 RepID=I0A1V4_FERFK|nr:hypothetical protein [Fervidicoccus fontis]AFH42961.1 hypothetical protein FFONT_0973 [Fervidicoccus fontis Kam940]